MYRTVLGAAATVLVAVACESNDVASPDSNGDASDGGVDVGAADGDGATACEDAAYISLDAGGVTTSSSYGMYDAGLAAQGYYNVSACPGFDTPSDTDWWCTMPHGVGCPLNSPVQSPPGSTKCGPDQVCLVVSSWYGFVISYGTFCICGCSGQWECGAVPTSDEGCELPGTPCAGGESCLATGKVLCGDAEACPIKKTACSCASETQVWTCSFVDDG